MAKSKEQRAGYEDLASIIGGNCGDAIRALLADLEAAESEVATLRQQLSEERHRKFVELWGTREIKRRIADAVDPYKPIVELAKRIVENRRDDQNVVLTVDVAALEAAIAALAAKEANHA